MNERSGTMQADPPAVEEVVVSSPLLSDPPAPEPVVEKPEAQEETEIDFDAALTLDDLPQDEPLYGEGSPTPVIVKGWKQQFGDVYTTQIDFDTFYIWRTLSRFEYRTLVKNVEQAVATGTITQSEANMNNEEQIAELCLLYPTVNRSQLASYPAGLPSLIAQQVMEASSFVALDVRQL